MAKFAKITFARSDRTLYDISVTPTGICKEDLKGRGNRFLVGILEQNAKSRYSEILRFEARCN
jgi:hypothetical protein